MTNYVDNINNNIAKIIWCRNKKTITQNQPRLNQQLQNGSLEMFEAKMMVTLVKNNNLK